MPCRQESWEVIKDQPRGPGLTDPEWMADPAPMALGVPVNPSVTGPVFPGAHTQGGARGRRQLGEDDGGWGEHM